MWSRTITPSLAPASPRSSPQPRPNPHPNPRPGPRFPRVPRLALIALWTIRAQLVDAASVIDDTNILKYTASQLFGRLIGQAIREVDDEVQRDKGRGRVGRGEHAASARRRTHSPSSPPHPTRHPHPHPHPLFCISSAQRSGCRRSTRRRRSWCGRSRAPRGCSAPCPRARAAAPAARAQGRRPASPARPAAPAAPRRPPPLASAARPPPARATSPRGTCLACGWAGPPARPAHADFWRFLDRCAWGPPAT